MHFYFLSSSLSAAMMGRMGPLLAAALWIRRRVRGWCSIPHFLRARGGNLSSTAPTLTTTCPPRPCHETPQSTARGKPSPSLPFTVLTLHFLKALKEVLLSLNHRAALSTSTKSLFTPLNIILLHSQKPSSDRRHCRPWITAIKNDRF